MSALTCPACTTPAVADARYCHNCGVALTARHPETPMERRVVTVLFGDLSDFTAWAEDLDPERVGEVTDRVLAALAAAVHEVDGHVDKLTGDGIMAVFGAPTAHEDDVERAVRAALAMQDAVRRLVAHESGGGRRLGLRVGLNTGEVLAGVQASLAYTVVGDTVNTASRLADAAGVGSIYAGRSTALPTMSTVAWRALPPLRLKGKREPVPAYELVAMRPGASRLELGDDAPFVGRDGELGQLIRTSLEVVEDGAARALCISGEAGVGKSRLVAELARFLTELPGSRVLWGRATPYGVNRHLAPLIEVLRTAAGISESDPPEEASAALDRLVHRLEPPPMSLWAPTTLSERLLTLLGLPVATTPDSSATPPREPTGTDPVPRDTVIDGLATLLRALANEGPVMVVLDDLQWATRELCESISQLARRLRGPILLVLIDRDGTELPNLPPTVVQHLAPLDDETAHRLLRAYLGGAELTAGASQALLGRAQGNPYFLAELLHLLVDQGLLARDGTSGWRLVAPLPDDVLPAAVQSVLAARIDSLDPVARQVLRGAAVLGLRLPAMALGAVEQRQPDEVRRALAALADRQLLRRPVPTHPAMWSFAHPMARDVAYGALPKVDRARRHFRAAEWARRHGQAELGSPAEVDGFVAGQAEQAVHLAASMQLPGDDPVWSARRSGFESLLRLGKGALIRHEYRNAAHLLQRALKIAASSPGRDGASEDGDATGSGIGRIAAEHLLGAHVGYAQALTELGRLADAERVLLPALEQADGTVRLEALTVLGNVRQKQGRDEEAVEALIRVLAEAGELGEDGPAAAAVRRLGLVDYYAGRLRMAEARFHQALEMARRAGDRRGTAWALQHVAWSATTRGDYQLADESLEAAAQLFGELEDAGGLAWCAGTECLVRALQGRLHDARAAAQALVPLAETLAEGWGVALCLTIDALAAAELGEVSAAEKQAARAERVFAEAEDAWGHSLALIARGVAARARGDFATAEEHFGAAVAVAEAGRQPVNAVFGLIGQGLSALGARRLRQAEDAASRAMALLDRVDLEPHATLGVAVLSAQVCRARGEPEQAVDLLRGAVDAETASSLLFPRRQALAHLAGALLDTGHVEEALVVARQAVQAPAEDVRSRVVALRALATALAASGETDEAQRVYREALEIATSTEANGEAEPTRQLLDALRTGATPAG